MIQRFILKLCISMWTCTYGWKSPQKRASFSLKLKLQTALSHHINARTRSQVLSKCNKNPLAQNSLSSSKNWYHWENDVRSLWLVFVCTLCFLIDICQGKLMKMKDCKAVFLLPLTYVSVIVLEVDVLVSSRHASFLPCLNLLARLCLFLSPPGLEVAMLSHFGWSLRTSPFINTSFNFMHNSKFCFDQIVFEILAEFVLHFPKYPVHCYFNIPVYVHLGLIVKIFILSKKNVD